LLGSCGFKDCKVFVYDIENDYSQKFSYVAKNPVRNVKFSADSNILCVSCEGGVANLLDMTNGNHIRTLTISA
jgi:hypothetical protein